MAAGSMPRRLLVGKAIAPGTPVMFGNAGGLALVFAVVVKQFLAWGVEY